MSLSLKKLIIEGNFVYFFDADVNEVGSQCVGGVELVSHKAKLQTLSDETHFALKKNVFQHYEQFIETAKDISCKFTR